MITWGHYVGAVTVLLGLYYGIILILYKSKKNPVKRLRQPAGEKAKPEMPGDQVLFPEKEGGSSSFDAASGAPVHSLVDELQAYVSQAGKQQASQEEVLDTLRLILQKYPHIPGSIFQNGINNLIEVIVESNCGFRLHADEIGELWETG